MQCFYKSYIINIIHVYNLQDIRFLTVKNMDSSTDGNESDTSSSDIACSSELDKLFWDCDPDGLGIVKASVLVPHIVNVLESQLVRYYYFIFII